MRIALVHDSLNQLGGAEYVLLAFHNMFPHAPIFTLVDDKTVSRQLFKKADIKTSFLQNLPLGVRKYKWYLPIHPTATENLDLSGYDVVLSDSSAFSKGVVTKPETIHVCYCHTPTRYLWHDTHNYTEDLHQGRLVKKLLPVILTRLRMWDQQAARRVDHFVANSYETARRIKKYYQRESVVVHPPIRWRDYSISKELGDFYLVVGRMRPYKKIDLAVKAFNKLGLPLVIVGKGEEYKRIKNMAGPNITVLKEVSDVKKRWLFAKCQAFIMPQEEDFGMAAVEAMSAGRPVIAYSRGGALETVVPGLSGEFFEEQSVDALIDILRSFEPNDYDSNAIREHAKKFEYKRFQDQMLQLILQARRGRAQRSLPNVPTETTTVKAVDQLEINWP